MLLPAECPAFINCARSLHGGAGWKTKSGMRGRGAVPVGLIAYGLSLAKKICAPQNDS